MTKLREEDAVRRQASGRSRDFLEVLSRSITVIEAMGTGREALTLSDIARLADLPKPSVNRILYTLCSLGYVEAVGRTFRLTPKIMRLATSFLGTAGNSRVLQMTCDELSAQTQQSCLAGVLDGEDVLVVAYAMAQQLMAPFLGVGVRFPAFCTAAGRILLGELTDDELDRFMTRLQPVPQTEATILDKDRIRAEILTAREQGFATMEDEYAMGWRTIAYPLRRHDGSLFGTLSLNCRKLVTLTDASFDHFKSLCANKAAALQPLLL